MWAISQIALPFRPLFQPIIYHRLRGCTGAPAERQSGGRFHTGGVRPAWCN